MSTYHRTLVVDRLLIGRVLLCTTLLWQPKSAWAQASSPANSISANPQPVMSAVSAAMPMADITALMRSNPDGGDGLALAVARVILDDPSRAEAVSVAAKIANPDQASSMALGFVAARQMLLAATPDPAVVTTFERARLLANARFSALIVPGAEGGSATVNPLVTGAPAAGSDGASAGVGDASGSGQVALNSGKSGKSAKGAAKIAAPLVALARPVTVEMMALPAMAIRPRTQRRR